MGTSDGKWEIVSMSEFLLYYSPNLRSPISICNQFPPLHILNQELMAGGNDLGMSGGCFWKPFKLTKDDYLMLREEILSNPNINVEYDETLEVKTSIKQWCGTVLSKHNPRKKQKAI